MQGMDELEAANISAGDISTISDWSHPYLMSGENMLRGLASTGDAVVANNKKVQCIFKSSKRYTGIRT